MLRFLRKGSLLALALPLIVAGAVYAGGAHCDHEKAMAAADKEVGTHCNLAKNVNKTAKMTDTGAVVTMEGKTEEAVNHIHEHLAEHQKGEPCPDCPFSMEGVTSTVKMTDKGGEVTMTASDPKTIKKVQEWAKTPAGDCCGKDKKKSA